MFRKRFPKRRTRTTAYLFIKDIKSSRKAGYDFIHKDVKFKDIELCGTITHIENVRNVDNSEFFIYTIDDGTGCINCVIATLATNEDFSSAESNFSMKMQSKSHSSLKSKQNKTIQMTVLACDQLKRFNYRTLCLNDEVRVSGILKEEKSLKYVLVENVEKITKIKTKMNYFKELFDFYKLKKC